MRSKHWFYCPDGHVFQHDSLTDDSVSWDSHVPARCKEELCDWSQNLFGPFLDEEQAQYVYQMRNEFQEKRARRSP